MKLTVTNKRKLLARRKSALERLEAQLIEGTKNDKQGTPVELSDEDKKRIKKEINVLTTKTKGEHHGI